MKKIDSYINSEFNQILVELSTHLEGSFDINLKKKFIATYIPKEVEFRSGALVDTLINLMMSEALESLGGHGVSIQNKFFEADFETKIQNIIRKQNLGLVLNPVAISFSRDPRVVNGVIAGGATFVIGSAVTTGLLIMPSLIGGIISGIATFIISALAYKVTYGKFTEQARDKLRNDISTFLTTSEQQLKEWLYSINDLFDTEFNDFLSNINLNKPL